VRRLLDEHFRHLPKRPAGGGDLLDFGCGGGSFLAIAESCGWRASGVDPDPKAVAKCLAQGLTATAGGMDVFDGKEALFDQITMNHVVEHVYDPPGVLQACWRLLKPGGRLWLQTPNIESLGHEHYGPDWRGLEPPRHLVIFSGRALESELRKAGFSRVEKIACTSPLPSIVAASDAMRNGRPAGEGVGLDASQRKKLRKLELQLVGRPSRDEFLTFAAFK